MNVNSRSYLPTAEPIVSLSDVFGWKWESSENNLYSRSLALRVPSNLNESQKLLICHDMKGGYVEDKLVQGGRDGTIYRIWDWSSVDIFVYFSHNLVTIPPVCWTNAAHKNGVKVLGTFITEWDNGKDTCSQILQSEEKIFCVAQKLTEVAFYHNFDGWLINIENKIEEAQIPLLIKFLEVLRSEMKSKLSDSLVIWYDSVTKDGDLAWQDKLNEKNKAFFDITDGIFTNYSWTKHKEMYPRESAAIAKERKSDVFMGLDVFAAENRGLGYKTGEYLGLSWKEDVSAALFAPAWVYETKQEPNFEIANEKLWNGIKEGMGSKNPKNINFPFFSNFDQGVGKGIWIEGKKVSTYEWNNLSCQSFQPLYHSHLLELKEEGISIKSQINSNVCFEGGSCYSFSGIIPLSKAVIVPLFEMKTLLTMDDVSVKFGIKSDRSGPDLSIISVLRGDTEDEMYIIYGDQTNECGAGSEYLMKSLKTTLSMISMGKGEQNIEAASWTLRDYTSSGMLGKTLVKVLALLHWTSKKFNNDVQRSDNTNNYNLHLGFVGIGSKVCNMALVVSSPLSFRDISWAKGVSGNSTVSLTLDWSALDKADESTICYPTQWDVYVEWSPTRGENSVSVNNGNLKWVGVAFVQLYRCCKLIVPNSVKSFRFLVQPKCICGVRLDLSASKFSDVIASHC